LNTFVQILETRNLPRPAQYELVHKDTISNGRCVVPLRKEYMESVKQIELFIIQNDN